jgi:hypothetical protein
MIVVICKYYGIYMTYPLGISERPVPLARSGESRKPSVGCQIRLLDRIWVEFIC